MKHDKPAWRRIFESYPCEYCGAHAGEECTTTSGTPVVPHAIRTRHADRCPICGTMLHADAEPGSLCPKHELVRALEIERASYYRRHRTPGE